MDYAPGAFFPRLVQMLGILALRPWIRLCFRARVRSAVRTMPDPCVFAANHRSFFDPPFVGMWRPRPLSYFARASLWQVGPIRFMLDLMYGIPVEREHAGLSSMKGAVLRLRQGISVLVFPEGTRTRTGELGQLREGPALFARPCRRTGGAGVHPPQRGGVATRIGPARLCGPPIEIRFGSPLLPPAGLDPRRQDAWVMRRLERWMRRQERDPATPPWLAPSHRPGGCPPWLRPQPRRLQVRISRPACRKGSAGSIASARTGSSPS